MIYEKNEQLQLLTWSLIIVGPAMAIPGALVFGVIEYVCGYLIFSAVLLACTIVIGNAFHKLQTFKSRSDARDIARWN